MKLLTCIACAYLGACSTSNVVEEPDAGAVDAPVTCEVQVLQTINGVSTCAVTVTVEVHCEEAGVPGDVSNVAITATTNPTLETGLQSSSVAIRCEQTQRLTFAGMPCAESASGLAVLNDGTTCGNYTR